MREEGSSFAGCFLAVTKERKINKMMNYDIGQQDASML
jgi:hypothetical protein